MGYPYQGIEPDQYQREALRTERTPPITHTDDDQESPERAEEIRLDRMLHAALGMATETGELQDMLKKHLIYGRDFDPINVIEECGDVLWYIALALDACGYRLSDCMERNLAKLRTRFPDQFSNERANNRDLIAERESLSKLKPEGDQ